MLEKEASKLGHDTVMLDAKITQVNTDSKKEEYDLGDVVLEEMCKLFLEDCIFTSLLWIHMEIPVIGQQI